MTNNGQPMVTDYWLSLRTTTWLAAAFNMGIVLLLCFWLLPRIEQSIVVSARNHETIQSNNDLLRENQRQIEVINTTMKRLNESLRRRIRRIIGNPFLT